MAKKRKIASDSDEEQQEEKANGEQQEEEPNEEQEEEEASGEQEEEKANGEEQEEKVNFEEEGASEAEPAATVTASENHEEGGGEDEDDDDENEAEGVQSLLEPFGKDQLIEILRDAAVKYPDVYDQINKIADIDPAHRKIFVHGLGWDTTVESLNSFFSKYGEIEDCNAICDKISGKSKGYGFILFKHRSGARKALKQPQKRIGTRMTACQLASSGPVPPTPPVSEYTQRKIYVSNVSADIDTHKLLQFFAKYGEIEEGPLGLDKQTGKPKGFALFVYKSAESAKKALEDPHKNFEGHVLHCQKAIDGPKPNKPHHHHHQGPHHQHAGRVSHFQRNDNAGFMGGMGGNAAAQGHMMAPAGTSAMQFNQGAAAAAASLNPAIGQALTALLATQGAGFGLTNLLGSLNQSGLPQVNQTVPTPMLNNTAHGTAMGGYGNPSGLGPNMMGTYGAPAAMQGGYPNQQMGQSSAGRNQQAMGHMGGVAPYMGH